MKITAVSVARLSAIGLMALVVGVVGCKSSGDRSTGQKWHDRGVAKDVKKELSRDPTYKYNDVNVSVYDSTVQLTGFVETPDQRKRAAELAAETPGARQVINEIMLKSVPTGPATIRDPLGRETGRLMPETNAPSRPQNPPNSETAPQQQDQ